MDSLRSTPIPNFTTENTKPKGLIKTIWGKLNNLAAQKTAVKIDKHARSERLKSDITELRSFAKKLEKQSEEINPQDRKFVNQLLDDKDISPKDAEKLIEDYVKKSEKQIKKSQLMRIQSDNKANQLSLKFVEINKKDISKEVQESVKENAKEHSEEVMKEKAKGFTEVILKSKTSEMKQLYKEQNDPSKNRLAA